MPMTQYRGRRPWLTSLLSIVTAALLGGCAGGYVPPEAINPPTATFAASISTMGTALRTDRLTGYRHDIRDGIMIDVLRAMAEKRPLMVPTPADWLCQPQFMYSRKLQLISAVEVKGKLLADRTQGPSDKLGELFSALGRDYSIVASDAMPPTTWSQWVDDSEADAKAGKAPLPLCLASIETANLYQTRTLGGPENFGIGEAITLFETIWGVIKTVVTDGLKNVDMERRAAAIRAYFSDQTKVNALKSELARIESFVDVEWTLQQNRTAGRARADFEVLFDLASPHWTAVSTITGSPDCQLVALGGTPARPTSPARVRCMEALRSAVKAPLSAALDSADKFDVALAQTLPADAERLSKQLDTLREIALGRNPPEERVKALWAAMLRYVAFSQSVQTTISDANVKKISDAWDGLMKALKN
jgi:hypothetical protein